MAWKKMVYTLFDVINTSSQDHQLVIFFNHSLLLVRQGCRLLVLFCILHAVVVGLVSRT